MVEIVPLGQRVVVKRIVNEQIKGILIPKDVQRRSLVGLVVHTGEDAVWVKPGDKVLYGTFSGFQPYLEDELKDKYEDCLVMNCEDILAIIKEVP